MKVREIYRVGDLIQAIGGLTVFLDRDNCNIFNKTKSTDGSAIILHLRRESDGDEGKSYLRVREEFKTKSDELLNRMFANEAIMGLTLNQLNDFDLGFGIESLQGRLSIQ